MHSGQSYKIHDEILGIILTVKPRATVLIPKGAIVSIVGGPVDGERMVDVHWNGKTIMLFAQDLRERGKLIGDAPALRPPSLPDNVPR